MKNKEGLAKKRQGPEEEVGGRKFSPVGKGGVKALKERRSDIFWDLKEGQCD